MDFQAWSKIPRFNKTWEITEKIDGTNGVLYWSDHHDGRFDTSSVVAQVGDLYLYAGSRNRWLRPESDNFGFARWAKENAEELSVLGKGRHFGEWYGSGIQRNYGLTEKRFCLFDTKWDSEEVTLPKGVEVVPVLLRTEGPQLVDAINQCLSDLWENGSVVSQGFAKPEGIVVRHQQHGDRYKVLLENDAIPKGIRDDPENLDA